MAKSRKPMPEQVAEMVKRKEKQHAAGLDYSRRRSEAFGNRTGPTRPVYGTGKPDAK